MRNFFVLIGSLSIYLAPLLIGVLSVLFAYDYMIKSPADYNSSKKVIVEIQKGWDINKIAENLEKLEIINSEWSLKMLAKFFSSENKVPLQIVAGEYELSPMLTPAEILKLISSGKVYSREIIIPEGSNIMEISKILAASTLMTQTEAFDTFRSSQLMAKLQVPAYMPEGFLMSGRYLFSKPITPDKVIYNLVQQGRQSIDSSIDKWKTRSVEIGFRPYDLLVIASLIEKEAKQPKDKPLFSSLIHNRLILGLPLQLNSVLAYGIMLNRGSSDSIEITLQDTKMTSIYNTYTNLGLPPTPICSPSLDSIRAAMFPEDTDNLYFITNTDLSLTFSPTYKAYLAQAKLATNVGANTKNPFVKPLPRVDGVSQILQDFPEAYN